MTAVDVIVNCRNYGRFVGDAIQSALDQNGVSVRVTVVDDGSTDETADVLREFGDRIVAIHQPNGGQASALNAGFTASDAELVVFLDADDVLLTGALARAAGLLEADPAVIRVQWAMSLADGDLVPSGVVVPSAHVPMPNGDVRSAERRYGFDLCWAATSGNMFRRAAVDRLFPIPEEPFRIGADWYLQHMTALLGPVLSITEPGTLRRVHGANAYEQAASDRMSMRHVRASVELAAATIDAMRAFVRADGDLGYGGPRAVSTAADRMISLRLEPILHPLPGDRRLTVLRDGLRASAGRDDCAPPLRLAFAAWFTAMAIAPRPIARTLARWWLFPEQRPPVNRLLATMHRREPTETRP